MIEVVRRRLRRTLEIFVLALILGALSLLMIYANSRMIHLMEGLKQSTMAMLEERLGRRVSYQRLSPSVFGFLEVRQLRVYSLEPDQRPLLDLSRVTVHYSLWRLIRSKDPVQAVSAVHLSNSSVDVDRERDRELLDILARLAMPGPNGNGRTGFRPPPRIVLSGSNISLRYGQRNWSAGLSGLFFSIRSEGDAYRVSLRFSADYRLGAQMTPAPTLSSRLTVSGKVDRRLAWSDLAVRIDSLSTAFLSLKRQTLQVTYDGRTLELDKIQDRAPLDLRVSYDRETGQLASWFIAEGLHPARLVRLGGPLSKYDRWLESNLSASGSVVFDAKSGGLRYQADVDLRPAEGLIPVDLYLSVRLHGDEKILVLRPLIVHSPQGTVEFSGDLLLDGRLPAGLLRLSGVRAPWGPEFDASLVLEREAGYLNVRGESLRLGDSAFTDFRLRLDPRHVEVPFELSASLADPQETGSVGAVGRLVAGARPSLSFDASLRRIASDSLVRLLGLQNRLAPSLLQQLGGLSLSTDFSLETNFRHYEFSSDNVQITQRTQPENQARFGLELIDGEVKLKALTAKWGQYSIAGHGEASILPWQTEFAASFFLQDLPYQLKGVITGGSRIELNGSYGLRAAVLLNGLIDPELLPAGQRAARGTIFSLTAAELPIPLPTGKVLLTTDLEGAVADNGAVYARSGKTEVTGIPYLPIRENRIQTAFFLQNGRLLLERIAYWDRISSVSGSGEFTVGGFAPIALQGSVRLQDSRGSEQYALGLRIAEGKFDAAMEFNRSPLARAGDLAISGELAGSLNAKGSWAAPELSAVLRLQDGKLKADPLAVELALSYRDRLLSLDSLSFSLLNHKISQGRGRWDLGSGAFAFESKYSFDYFGSPVRMELAIKGSSAPVEPFFPLDRLFAREIQATLRLADIRVGTRPYPEWLIRLHSEGEGLFVEGGPSDSIRGTISRDGRFSLKLMAPLPLQLTAAGLLQRERIDAELQVDRFDIRVINDALRPSTDIIQFTRGFGTGKLRISGLITDPDWFGSLDVQDAAMRFLLSPDLVEPINGRLVFEEKTFTMPRLASYAGKIKVEAEGSFSLDHWIPVSFELFFYVNQNPGAHLRYTFAPVSLDGFATGAVRVSGDQESTRVEGKITANQCRIALVRTEELAAPPPALIPLWIDLKINAGRGVEFYWPAVNFPVVHTYAKPGDQVNLVLDGESGQVTLIGSVDIRGGEIFYFDRSFYLKRGSIRFDSAPGEVDPWINALAEIRERDQNNEEVKIYLEANNRLSQFSPRFYSDPVRADLEIMDLIGGNIFNRFGDSDSGLSAVMLTTDIVGQFGLLAPFEQAVRRLLNLDLFSIRTQLLQTILLGKLLGDGTSPGARNPLDNTTLSLGKYLGTDLFVQALVRFQTVQAVNAVYNIQTEGELTLEWNTPFFLLVWTFVPKHPENLFLSDNSIGLSWKFSY